MKDPLATFRQAGSFIAGLLIGISITVPVSEMLAAEPGDWQTISLLCAFLILALGLTLHVVVATKPQRRAVASELGEVPAKFPDWAHQG